ncbi:MAG: GNAT family N-acetyltransferase [Pseudomonadota bacterium]
MSSIRTLTSADFEPLVALLEANDLDPSDLHRDDMPAFVGAFAEGALIAAGGLHQFDRCGWLRSLVTAPEARSRGLAGEILAALETHAGEAGVESVFLLTDTATRFFQRRGFTLTDRATAPPAIRTTEQFASLCPDSADFMCKTLAE